MQQRRLDGQYIAGVKLCTILRHGNIRAIYRSSGKHQGPCVLSPQIDFLCPCMSDAELDPFESAGASLVVVAGAAPLRLPR